MTRLRTRFETLEVAELAIPYHPGTSPVWEVVRYRNEDALRFVSSAMTKKKKRKGK